jgi:hypothetical protein
MNQLNRKIAENRRRCLNESKNNKNKDDINLGLGITFSKESIENLEKLKLKIQDVCKNIQKTLDNINKEKEENK